MPHGIGIVLGVVEHAALPAVTFASSSQHGKLSLTVSPLVAEEPLLPGGSGRVSIVVENRSRRMERVTITPLDWVAGAKRSRTLAPLPSTSMMHFGLEPGERRSVSMIVSLAADAPSPASLWGGVMIRATQLGTPARDLKPASTILVYDNAGEPRGPVRLDALRLLHGRSGSGVVVARLCNDGPVDARVDARLLITQYDQVVVDRRLSLGAIARGGDRMLHEHISGLLPGLATVRLQTSESPS